MTNERDATRTSRITVFAADTWLHRGLGINGPAARLTYRRRKEIEAAARWLSAMSPDFVVAAVDSLAYSGVDSVGVLLGVLRNAFSVPSIRVSSPIAAPVLERSPLRERVLDAAFFRDTGVQRVTADLVARLHWLNSAGCARELTRLMQDEHCATAAYVPAVSPASLLKLACAKGHVIVLCDWQEIRNLSGTMMAKRWREGRVQNIRSLRMRTEDMPVQPGVANLAGVTCDVLIGEVDERISLQ